MYAVYYGLSLALSRRETELGWTQASGPSHFIVQFETPRDALTYLKTHTRILRQDAYKGKISIKPYPMSPRLKPRTNPSRKRSVSSLRVRNNPESASRDSSFAHFAGFEGA